MSRSRILTSLAAASLGVALLGACSAESITERAVGFGLEQAAEGDQDIDIDFGGDGNAGFSISTDEGDFSVNFDEDNGSLVFETDEGDGVLNFNDEDGSVTFEAEDGSASVLGGSTVPAEWPAAVGVPLSADPDATFFSVLDLGTDTVISGIFEHNPQEPYAGTARAGFLASGWTIVVESTDGNGVYYQLANGASTASISSDNSGFTAVTINIATPG